MKKILFIMLFALNAPFAFSQLNQSQWLVGGGALGSYNSYTHSTSTFQNLNLQVVGEAGCFVIDKLAIGGRFAFSRTTDNNISPGNNNFVNVVTSSPALSNISIGPFIRYYLLPKASNINFFMAASYEYGISLYDPYYPSVLNRTNNFGFSFGPAFILNPHTSLMIICNYQLIKSMDSHVIATNLSVGVGFQIHLGNKPVPPPIDDQPKYRRIK